MGVCCAPDDVCVQVHVSVKRRVRRVAKVQRAIVGASLEEVRSPLGLCPPDAPAGLCALLVTGCAASVTESLPRCPTLAPAQIKSKRDQKPEVRAKAREAALKEIKARQKTAKAAPKPAAAAQGAKVAAGKKAQPKSGGRK